MDEQSKNYTVGKTGDARTFVIPGGARFGRKVHYTSFMKVDSGSQPLGDVTPIKLNDPNSYGKYIDVGQIRGSAGRPTTQLIQKMPMQLISLIDRLARGGMEFDVHVHFGECYDPRDIRQFSKGRVYEFATGTTRDNDALVALDDGEDAEIRETLAISAMRTYDYVPLAYRDRALETIINEITAVAIKKSRDCNDEVPSPLPMFAVTRGEGGSPGTGPYLYWSLDNGKTWQGHDIDTLADDEDAIGVDVGNGYIVVISGDAGTYSFTTLTGFYFPDAVGFDPEFTELNTGLVDNPTAIDSSGMDFFIVGDGGYIYKITEPSEGAVVLDAAEASGANALRAVASLDGRAVVAVGDNSTIVYSKDGESFALSPTQPFGVGVNAISVGVRYEDEWWVGFDNGSVYMTYDAGQHWSEVILPGQDNITAITSIEWASHSVGYIAGTVSGAGRIFRTICGGIKWAVQPQDSKYSMPVSDKFNALSVSMEDVNLVLAGGLGADGSDGSLVVGNDADM